MINKKGKKSSKDKKELITKIINGVLYAHITKKLNLWDFSSKSRTTQNQNGKIPNFIKTTIPPNIHKFPIKHNNKKREENNSKRKNKITKPLLQRFTVIENKTTTNKISKINHTNNPSKTKTMVIEVNKATITKNNSRKKNSPIYYSQNIFSSSKRNLQKITPKKITKLIRENLNIPETIGMTKRTTNSTSKIKKSKTKKINEAENGTRPFCLESNPHS